ncbi:MAG: quinolinate synthase NadA, partial [Oscillospiraceae bacterium]|nr:quinolinate synthase NadA [Oscillospiraceae bacterium]
MEKNLLKLIKKEKKHTNTLILAHTYQTPDVLDIADITGDSFALSKAAAGTGHPRVIMCGVRFMAETVKILSPEKDVILPAPEASCPMAEQINPERVYAFKKENPDAAVVCYVNTTAELKAAADVCVTSSSAVRILSRLKEKTILFIPDKNLGAYVKTKFPEKNFIFWEGCCPVHDALTEEMVLDAKKGHPGAAFAFHPECREDILKHADMTGSTSEIIDFIKKSEKPVVVGTERGVADYLSLEYPDKV